MPKRQTIKLVGPQAQDSAVSVSNQETVNFQVEGKGTGAKAPQVLETIAGARFRQLAGDGPCRSPEMIAWADPVSNVKQLYGVFGGDFVAINGSFGVTVIGAMTNTTGIARIARGRNFIMVVDNDSAFTYDGTTFAAITDLDFPTNFVPAKTVTHVVYLDGFFIVNEGDSDNFYISALEDPATWNALDFDAASVAPDNSLAIAASESILYIVGDETMQPYYNSGDADFPYEVYLNAVSEHGILAPQSIAESDAGVFYLGTTPEGGRFVVQIQGTALKVITHDEQEVLLGKLVSPETAYGFIFQLSGKAFYVLQLDPGLPSQFTLSYNIRSENWERRALQDGSAWRAAGHGVINNQNVIGSRLAGQIGTLEPEIYQDFGQQLIRRRVTEVFHDNNHLIDWWELVVDCDSGVGLVVGPDEDTDPQIRMRYSDTNGKTWSAVLEEPIGKAGEFERRAVFRNLGQSRQRVWEIEFSANVPLTIINLHAILTVNDD